MKTRVIRTAITELDEDEAYDLTQAVLSLTDSGLTVPTPTDKQIATARLFAEQLAETLG